MVASIMWGYGEKRRREGLISPSQSVEATFL